nr:hypothetical protein [Tanacetum cinerariifolium]
EEIDIFTGTDELLPPDIESENYDSKGDIHFLEELLFNDSISLPENESFYFGHHDDPSFPRPPPKPPDVAIFFKPDSGVLTTNVVKGSSGLRCSSAMPRLFIHVIYAISLSLYPFTERHAQLYFFSCLIRQVLFIGQWSRVLVGSSGEGVMGVVG